MATTTNYGWTTPDDTALVKDGASAIRSLGSAIDTSLAGAIVQVVNATNTTQASSSSTSYADTGLTATITPKSATNKILVIVDQSTLKTAGNSGNAVNLKLLRGATTLWTLQSQHDTATAVQFNGVTSMNWLDSPATTSATTYKTQFANNVAASAVYVQINGSTSPSSITLIEVKSL